MHRKLFVVFALRLSLFVAALLPGWLAAQTTRVYSGPTNGNLATLANWSPNTPAFANGDTLRFNGSVAGALSLTSSELPTWFNFDLTAGQSDTIGINATSHFRMRNITLAVGAGAFTVTGNADLRLEGSTPNTFTNDSGSLARLYSSHRMQSSAAIARTLIFAGSGDWELDARLSETHVIAITKTGTGTLLLKRTDNNNPGVISALGGVMAVTKLANGGSQSSIGTASATAGNLVIDGGTLRHVGTATSSTNRLFQLGRTTDAAVGTLDNSAVNAAHLLDFTNTGAITFGTANLSRTLRLVGSNTGENRLAAQIGDNGSAAVAVDKQGAGTWKLANVGNSYSGGTTIAGGTLILAASGAAGSGPISVVGGQLQVAAGATVTNDVVLTAASAGLLRPVNAGSPYEVGSSGSLSSQLAGGIDTTARLLASANASAGTSLALSFASADPGAANDGMRRSDVLTLTGTGGDLYVLQLGVDGLAAGDFLGWLAGGQWVLANAGSSGNNAGVGQLDFQGSFAAFQGLYGSDLTSYVGAYGADLAGGVVWAVLNHSSQFAVVAIPEPASLALLALAGVAGLRRRR